MSALNRWTGNKAVRRFRWSALYKQAQCTVKRRSRSASDQCSAIDAQRGNARGQGRRFHAEQFRCTAWSGNLSICLFQRVDDGLTLLALQLVSREERGPRCWRRLLATIFVGTRSG